MATRKNVAPAADVASADAVQVVRFSIGAREAQIADAWRMAGDAEVGAAVRFFNVLFAPVADGGHEGDIAALLPFKDGAKRSNEQQAFYDFAQMMYLVYKCGPDLAAVLKDRNVGGDTMVQRPGVKADGSPYKPQAKRALRDTLLGSADWGRFVKRLLEIKEGAKVSAMIEAGEIKEGEKPKGEAKAKNSEKVRGVNKIEEAIKIFRKAADAEKGDGSLDPVNAAKIAAYLADGLKTYGLV